MTTITAITAARLRELSKSFVRVFQGFPVGIRYTALLLVAFVLLASRRPQDLLSPQMYAEDGKFWYKQAFEIGPRSWFFAHGGSTQPM